VRQVHAKEVSLLFDTADHYQGLAEVGWRIAGRVRKWLENILMPDQCIPHIVLHDRLPATESMFGFQPFPDSLGRVPLLARLRFVIFQNLVSHPNPRSQFRPRDRSLADITRRN
jgi:hypothetical protein